jgi:hypothetical protein
MYVCTKFWLESLKVKGHLEYLDIHGKILYYYNLYIRKVVCEGADWIYLT